jgi:hypothetical protein
MFFLDLIFRRWNYPSRISEQHVFDIGNWMSTILTPWYLPFGPINYKICDIWNFSRNFIYIIFGISALFGTNILSHVVIDGWAPHIYELLNK